MKHRTTGRSLPLIAWLAGLLLVIALPLQAAVVARLSTSTTPLDQPIQLTLESQGEQDDSPDLSVLEPDFEILGRATQQSVSIINGSFSSKRSLILTLLPKREGSLTIPPIPFGDQQTAPLSLEVTDQPTSDSSQSEPLARVEMSLNKTSVYPEEEVILTVKLFQAAGVRGEQLEQPQPSQRDTRLQLLDEATYTVERDGQTYRVLERSYGLYAYQAGSLEIAPVRFRGRSGGSSLFSLLDTPFSTPGQTTRLVRATSQPVSLQIKPLPADFSGEHWLPARNVQLVETGIDGVGPIAAGKPLTRRIMLIADGLMSSQLPPITPQVPDTIKPYEERPQLQDNPRRTGSSGSRETVITLIPTKAGSFTLPAVEVAWWNTETDRREVARLPAKTLQVLPAAAGTGTATAAPASPAPVPEMPADATLEESPTAAPTYPEPAGIHWLVWVLGAAWLATLAGWWLSHRRHSPDAVEPAPSDSESAAPTDDQALTSAISALSDAYRRRDAAAARDAWLAWGQLCWPQHPPHNLTRLAGRCPPSVADAVLSLEKALYSPGSETGWAEEFDPETLKAEQQVQQAPSRTLDEELLPLNP